MGECDHLNDEGIWASHSRHGGEARFKMLEIGMEAGALPVAHRVVRQAGAVQLAGDPEGGRGFLTTVHLPTVVQDMDSWVWRGGQNQLRRVKIANPRIRMGACGAAIKDDGRGVLSRRGSLAPFPEGHRAVSIISPASEQSLSRNSGIVRFFSCGRRVPIARCVTQHTGRVFRSRLAEVAQRLPRLVR